MKLVEVKEMPKGKFVATGISSSGFIPCSGMYEFVDDDILEFNPDTDDWSDDTLNSSTNEPYFYQWFDLKYFVVSE
ncbi:hypothetical protein 65p224 [Aeromonas phage 65]|uniref:Uncharacterized protein n=2 Tax=Ishigurovirus osborne TaxID=260149 RepID=A0A219YC80_9CAUD|nr:hypothetical protein ST65p224 [Aeromonas phage 65]ADQ53232.1 hypothetical protein 65p224 [Aeromonas phage 65]APU01608.1 hypothetical protein [Aeromonas phage 65.2]